MTGPCTDVGNPRAPWAIRKLTYNVSEYPEPHILSREQVDYEINEAFKTWANVTNLTFAWVQDRRTKRHIDIKFVSQEHFDNSNILAHAHYPEAQYCPGCIHFNEDQKWSRGSDDSGYKFLQVAIHEIGHALGLSHTNNKAAIMHCSYFEQQMIGLHSEDIAAIQGLYGTSAF